MSKIGAALDELFVYHESWYIGRVSCIACYVIIACSISETLAALQLL